MSEQKEEQVVTVESKKEEESKVEAVEEPKAEEPKVEEPKTEEPKTEESKTEESKTEESKPQQQKKRKNNIVSDPSTLPASSDPKEILKQVEFYFSDQNLPKDKFLLGLTKENEGWIPISTIATFSRMRRFSPLETIVAALRESEDLLEVSENGELVRRKTPLDESAATSESSSNTTEKKPVSKGAQAFARSIYAKGFGEETSASQYDIEKYFEAFAPVTQVRLRRADDKKFKGSVFVEFANLEDAQRFLAQDPKPSYNGNDLLTMSKAAYVDMKSAEHGFNKNAKGGNRRGGNFNKKRRFDGNRNKENKKAKTEA
ncbi:uncharacterized protein SAPINGB_P000265 [Magnusiomyces paraingens]|uniref:HTH La-type RNA-binding domain-containing protein n=1 Tax=Magnusiomyces paraingens TaxID=2606893 RepID=A0A5E8AYH5_9ASCO|nr:uncharacterized protein SAPINGB_P000265 [Saprochaete ingens]VVT44026.1 unnamed protein product [Saprochaete ingens]